MIFDFGYRLKELRKKKKFSQYQVARLLNMSKSTISGYENNIKTPSLEVLKKLAMIYGVSSDYLLGIENREMISVEGLTRKQKEIMNSIIHEFRGWIYYYVKYLWVIYLLIFYFVYKSYYVIIILRSKKQEKFVEKNIKD